VTSRRQADRGTYALLAPSANRVKVGSASNIDTRIRDIARICPVPLMLIGRSNSFVESRIHDEIATAHVNGEWFEATPEVLAAIERHMVRIERPVDASPREKSRWHR